jgi:tetratricopeptide (TPR) repeat protein
MLGTLNRNRGQLNLALSLFQKTLDIYIFHNDIGGQRAAHNNLALAYQALKNDAEFTRHVNIAIGFGNKDPIGQSRSLGYLANYYYGLSLNTTKPSEKEQHLTDALDTYKKARDLVAGKRPSEEAEILTNMANMFFERAAMMSAAGPSKAVRANEEWRTTETSLRDAIRLAVEAKAPQTEASAHNSLGNTYKLQKRWNEALDEFKKALAIYKARYSGISFVASSPLSLRRDDVNVLWSMEDVCMRIPDYQQAVGYCDEEAKIDPASPNPDYNRACIYCLMGDPEVALKHFQKVKVNRRWVGSADTDDDLKCLWKNPEFIKIVRKGKTIPPDSEVVGGVLPPLTCPGMALK